MVPNRHAFARLAVCLVFAWAAGLVFERPAFADDWTIVVDYGKDAGAATSSRWSEALDAVDALRANGHTVTLIALGTRPDGRWRSADLYKVLKAETRDAALERLDAQADVKGYAFEVGSQVDHALAAALDRHEGTGALTVMLVGTFAGEAPGEDAEPDVDDGEADADPPGNVDDGDAPEAEPDVAPVPEADEPAWNAQAPGGSRVLALGSVSDAVAGLLAARDGWVGPGWLVLSYGAATVEAETWSPLGARDGAAPDRALTAQVTWSVVALPLAQTAVVPRTLVATTGEAGDRIEYDPGSARVATLVRAGGGAREARFRFEAIDPAEVSGSVVRVAPLPDPVVVAWTSLFPDARLWTPDGSVPATLDLRGTEATSPRSALLRIVRTRSGPAPRWTVRVVTKSGASVPGLGVAVDAEVPTGQALGSTNVRVTLAPPAAVPFDEPGVIRLSAEGLERVLEVAFHASAPTGVVRLERTGRDVGTLTLPAAAGEPRLAMRVGAENGNAPERVQVVMAAASESIRARLWLANGLERTIVPEVPFEVAVDAAFEVGLELVDRESWRALGPGKVTFTLLSRRGVDASGEASVAYRARRPSIQLGGRDTPRYVVTGGEVSGDPHQELVLDADGGDGEWLLARLAEAPVIEGEGPWYVDSVGSGRWIIGHRGPWQGEKPDPFADTRANRVVRVVWADGGTPGDVTLEVDVVARWGQRGWLFVGLAVAALCLAAFTFVQLRAPKVTGTLLYTVAGLAGTVGRLDLSPAGRRATVLRADERGALSLGKTGDPVGVVRATRVGGMLEVPGDDGVPERRLLVDGLALRVGRYALRYISGRPEDAGAELALVDVPDLLGPEFDLESGTFDEHVEQAREHPPSDVSSG